MEVRVAPHEAVQPDGSPAHPGLFSIFVDNWHRGHVWASADPHIYLYQRYEEQQIETITDGVERVLGDRRTVVLPPDLSAVAEKWDGVLSLMDEGDWNEDGD